MIFVHRLYQQKYSICDFLAQWWQVICCAVFKQMLEKLRVFFPLLEIEVCYLINTLTVINISEYLRIFTNTQTILSFNWILKFTKLGTFVIQQKDSMNQELNKLTFIQITPFHIIVKPALGHLCYPLTFSPSLQAHTGKIIYVEGLWSARNNSLHRVGKCSEVNCKGFIRRTKLGFDLKNDLVMCQNSEKELYSRIMLDYPYECCYLCGVTLEGCSKVL